MSDAALYLALQRLRIRDGQPQTVQVCAACTAALARAVECLAPIQRATPLLIAGLTVSTGPAATCALKDCHG